MTPKLSYNYIKEFIENNIDLILLGGEYIDNKSRLDLIDKDGYKYYTNFHVLSNNYKNNRNLNRFYKGNKFTIDNIILWIEKNNKPYYYASGEYIGNASKTIVLKCKKYNHEWITNWLTIFSNHNCPYCSKFQKFISPQNSLFVLYPELCKEWNYEKNDKSPKEYRSKSNTKIHWVCLVCKNQWVASIVERVNSNTGCPKCKNSKGEKRISNFLQKLNIDFIFNYRFKDCRDRLPLPFDFYISKYNICIEYDGELHYETYKNIIGDDKINKLLNCQKHDLIKTQYCLDKNIDLIRIPYWKFDKIEEILFKELSFVKGG